MENKKKSKNSLVNSEKFMMSLDNSHLEYKSKMINADIALFKADCNNLNENKKFFKMDIDISEKNYKEKNKMHDETMATFADGKSQMQGSSKHITELPVCVVIHSWLQKENNLTNRENIGEKSKTNDIADVKATSTDKEMDSSLDYEYITDEDTNPKTEKTKRNRGRPRKYEKTHLTAKDIFPEMRKFKRTKKGKNRRILNKFKKIKNQSIEKKEGILTQCNLQRKSRGRPKKIFTNLTSDNDVQNKGHKEKTSDQVVRLERRIVPPRKHLSNEYLRKFHKKYSIISKEEDESRKTSDSKKRKRGRPRKYPIGDDGGEKKKPHSTVDKKQESKKLNEDVLSSGNLSHINKVENIVKKRGRPRKYPLVNGNSTILKQQSESTEKPSCSKSFERESTNVIDSVTPKAFTEQPSFNENKCEKRGRGRPKKSENIKTTNFNKERRIMLLKKKLKMLKRNLEIVKRSNSLDHSKGKRGDSPKQQIEIKTVNRNMNKGEEKSVEKESAQKESAVKEQQQHLEEEIETIVIDCSEDEDGQNNKENILISPEENSFKDFSSQDKFKTLCFTSDIKVEEEDVYVDVEETSIIVSPSL